MSRFIKSRRTLVAIGCLFLIALVWLVLGWWLGIDVLVCLIATCVVLVLFILYLVIDQAFEKKQSEKLEKSIWDQSEEQKMAVRPEKREEIENLRQELSASIQKLKQSKLGGGRRGTSALYALPWYMIIGPPAAGKTTAIRNSGLEFPFGTDREIQGVGGTRNCDWWFSNSAIILDTAGRYTTEDEDREEWTAFLDILKKNRKRQPINGVMVCISIADLMNARQDELDWHARTIRKRIDELLQQLGVRYPVYLIFTKCDLLNGFVEFFEEFGRTQREQVWGCTLTAEQQTDPKPRAIFEKEFQVLYDATVEMRLARLTPGTKREARSRIFAFPMEFLSIKENLAYFVANVFQPNPYQEAPMFRGFYFTSGTQEGVPIDKVVASIAKAFGLSPEMSEQFNPEIQTKSYFIKNLFTDIIIPDDKLVRPSSKSGKTLRLARVGLMTLIVGGLLLFGLGITQSYLSSRAIVDATAADVRAFNDSPRNITNLNGLLRRITLLKESPLFAFGMDRNSSLLKSVEKLYFDNLRPMVQSTMLQPLQQNLRSGGRSRSDLYDGLKAYLLLTSEHERVVEDTVLQNFLRDELNRTLGDKLTSSYQVHVEYFSKEYGRALEKKILEPFAVDEGTVGAARRVAGKRDIAGMYENLKRSLGNPAAYRAPDQVFETKNEVRGVFTKDAFEKFEQKVSDREYEQQGKEAEWVLGVKDGGPQELAGDLSDVADSLRNMYYRQYADEWWKFLLGLKVQPSGNLPDAANQLKVMSDPRNSLIRKLFDDVLGNTRFEKSSMDKIAEKARAIAKMKGGAHPVEIQFKSLHQYIAGDPGKGLQSKLDDLIAQLGQAADELDGVSSGKDAKKIAQGVLNGSGPFALTARQVQSSLKASDDETRRAIGGIFMQAMSSAWKGVIVETGQYLNDQWGEQVLGPAKQLPGGDLYSTSLVDLASVYAEGGALSTFLEKELRPFFESGDSWEPKKWERVGLELSSPAKGALLQVKATAQSLFRGKEAGGKVFITVNSPTPKGDADKVGIDIGGKMESFDVEEGKKTFTFDWPGGGGATILLIEKGKFIVFSTGEHEIGKLSFDGEWGLFKLVNAGKPVSKGGDTRCTWTFEDNITLTATLRTDKGSSNPFGKSLRFSLPEKLF